MILTKEVSMIFPSEDLGKRIASEDARTQCRVFVGFAEKQLLDCISNNQPIINLVAIIPMEVIVWFTRIYQEIVRQKILPKNTVDYLEDFAKELDQKIDSISTNT